MKWPNKKTPPPTQSNKRDPIQTINIRVPHMAEVGEEEKTEAKAEAEANTQKKKNTRYDTNATKFKGKPSDTKFVGINLSAKRPTKQSKEIWDVSLAHALRKNDSTLSKSIEESTKKDRAHFVKTQLDQAKFETAAANPHDPPVEDPYKKYTEQSRMKSQQDYKLKKWNGYKQLGEKIYSIVWGQCNGLMKEELKLQTDYTMVSANNDIIWLLTLVNMVCLGSEFRKICDPTYQILM